MLRDREHIFLYKLSFFLLFCIVGTGFSSSITFDYQCVGDSSPSTYSDGTPYTSSTVNSKQVVTLKGKIPASGQRIMLFPFVQVQNGTGEFICQVDKSNILAPNAMAGIMVRESIEPGKNYSLIGLSGNNYINYEQCINGTTSSMATAQLPAGTNTFYIKAVINNAIISFYVAPQLSKSISDWLFLGQTICIPNNVLVGPFLVPGSTSAYDVAKFTDLQNNLVGKTFPNRLGKVAATTNNFDPILADLVTNHASRMAADPTYAKLFNQLKDYHSKATEFTIASSDSEVTKIQKAACNAELYVVDIIYNSIVAGPGGTPKYSFTPSQYKLYYNLNVLGFMHIVQSAVSTCDQALTYTWKDKLLSIVCGLCMGYKVGQLVACGEADLVAEKAKTTYQADLDTHDRIFLHSADYVANLAILSSLSKPYRDSYLSSALQFSGQLKEMMGFAHTLYQDNNIPINVYSAITFLELVNGTKSTLSILNPMIDSKFDAAGCYGEGTAYLEEVLSNLLPMYYFGRKANWLASSDLKQSVLSSGKWLLNISDAVSGSVPAVDDAWETTPWLAPFSYLNNDTKYLDYTNKYFMPISGYGLPSGSDFYPAGVSRTFLTYPAAMFTPTPNPVANPDVSFNGGVGKIHFKEGRADVNVCLLAENGQDLTSGNSHDQQDNGSLTLNRATGPSPSQIDRLIIDPGYAGFDNRHATSFYQLHNTVLVNGSGVDSNQQFSDADIKNIVKTALNISSATVLDNIYGKVESALMGTSASAIDKSAGTDSANLEMPFSNGLRIRQYFDLQSAPRTSDWNVRNVINYDGEVIVVDNIQSKQNNYGLHWNLPPNTARVGANQNILYGTAGNSQIRMSIFSQDQNPMIVSLPAFATKYPSEVTSTGVLVDSVTISNSGSGSLFSNFYFNYLTVIETKDAGVDLKGSPAYTTFSGTNAAVCVTKTIPSTGITRYIFVNNVIDNLNNKNTVVINGVSTNALFGVMDFNTGTNVLDNILAYGYGWIINNGTTVSGVLNSKDNIFEFKLKTVLSNQVINANTTVATTNAVNVSNAIVNSPAILNVTGGKKVMILPETRINKGSTATIKATP